MSLQLMLTSSLFFLFYFQVPCPSNSTCTDIVGAPGDASGRTCVCQSGFVLAGTRCVDVDACIANPCPNNAQCTEGSRLVLETKTQVIGP